MSTHTTTPAPQTIELIRRLLEAAHRPEPANDPTICAICGAPLTDTTSSICPDCQELERTGKHAHHHKGRRPHRKGTTMSFHQWLETQLADIRQAQLDATLQGNNPLIQTTSIKERCLTEVLEAYESMEGTR